jgi:hypothetical protein
MRTRAAAFFTVAAVAAVAAGVACSSNKQGALVIAMETDLHVPDDIDGIGLAVVADGQVKYSGVFGVGHDGEIHLPATLAVLEPDKGTPSVRVRAVAFKGGKAQVVRDVVTTVPHERVALLRLPLRFLAVGGASGSESASMFQRAPVHTDSLHLDDNTTGTSGVDLFLDVQDTACDTTKSLTNVDGACVDAHVDSTALPDYEDALLYGDAGPKGLEACFDVGSCFVNATPVTIDAATCTFPLGMLDAATLNVGMVTASGAGFPTSFGNIVPLDIGSAEGATIDPIEAGTRLVHLPAHACANAAVRSIVVTTGSCSAKPESQEIDGAGATCAPDANDEAGARVDASSVEAGGDASGDADADAAPADLVIADNTGVTGIVVQDQFLFAASAEQLQWYAIAANGALTAVAANLMMPATAAKPPPTDAGGAKPVAELAADGTVVSIVFAPDGPQMVMPYTAANPAAAMIQGVQAIANPPLIYGSVVTSGSVYYGSENSGMGFLQVPGANTGMTTMTTCDVGSIDGLAPLAQVLDGANLYTVISDANGAASLYEETLPLQCIGTSGTSLALVSNTIAKSLAVVMNPNMQSDHRLVMSGYDTVGKVTRLTMIDLASFQATTLVSDMNINGSAEPPHPLAVDTTKGIVYYADSAGALRSVDVFGATPTVPATSKITSDAFGVAIYGSTIFFTSETFGVRAASLPLKM